jgi:hypothetical protein
MIGIDPGLQRAAGHRTEARTIINAYEKALAEAWDIDEGDIAHREEFMMIADAISDTIATKYPDGLPQGPSKPPRGN